MKLTELQVIRETLMDLHAFVVANSDGDESGIFEELDNAYSEAQELVKKEIYRLHLRNAKASIIRKRKKR
jgi:hypothetical protein